MDNSFMNNTFTWALEDTSANKQNSQSNINQQQQQQQQQSPQEIINLSDADLFQFLLGEEAQQAAMTQTHSVAHHTDEDSSANEDTIMKEKLSSNNAASSTARKPKSSNGPPATSTGRLDFRPIHDHIPESQLKAMTSKERRQLRNKISARNFRNRRKEYIGTLEDELNQQKAENSQLKLELKWVKQKMETLQKENDKLRVDLMLGGINLPTTATTTTAPAQPAIMSVATTNTSPYLFDSTNLLNSTLNLSNTSSSSSSDSTLSSPPNLFTDFPDNWDFVLPTEDHQNRDTYLSHAVVPNWNINHVLQKETSTAMVTTPSTNLIQQYPLLAPALMSIVLAHTMTMSTDEILATAKLNPLPSTHLGFNDKDPFNGSTIMTDKEAKAVWDILEPLTLMQSRNEKLAIQPSDTKGQSTQSSTVNPFCPLLWVQTRICRYLCEFAANYCTTNALPSPTAGEQDSTKKFVLCRQFHKAKRYITACQ
ncbi:hypothetical protein MBANPS3_001813 [Mucor bainieri]